MHDGGPSEPSLPDDLLPAVLMAELNEVRRDLASSRSSEARLRDLTDKAIVLLKSMKQELSSAADREAALIEECSLGLSQRRRG